MGEKDVMVKDLYVYQAGWQRCEKGHSYGPATRDHYLIHYIVSGKGKYKVGNKEYVLEQGEGFLIMPGDITYYQADQDEPWEYYWIGFSGRVVKEIIEKGRLGKDHLVFSYKKDEKLQRLIHRLYLCGTEYNVNEYEQMGYAYLFLAELTKEEEVRNIPLHEYVNKAIHFIQHNYSYDITIGQVANHVGIERTYMFRLFKKILNMSPQEYMIKYRLDKAREMLMNSEMGITEIAYSCGFREMGYFSRCFKNNYQLSPSQYRKKKL